MLWISKKSKFTYLCVLLPMFLITALYSIIKQNTLILPVSVILLIVFSYAIRKLAIKELKFICSKLTDELETQEYINFFEYAVNDKRSNDVSVQMKSALLTGYIAIGDFSKAEPLFYEVRGYLSVPFDVDKQFNPLSSCINYLIYTGQYNDAYALLIQMSERKKLLSNNFKHRNEVFNVLRIKYLCATNQFDNIADFNNVFNNTFSLYSKLQLSYFLGCYYENNNKHGEALAHFKYVSANGKDLYIAQMSKNKIDRTIKEQSGDGSKPLKK